MGADHSDQNRTVDAGLRSFRGLENHARPRESSEDPGVPSGDARNAFGFSVQNTFLVKENRETDK